MLKRINDFLGGLPMTIVSGIAIAISLVLILTKHQFIFDPAWIAVIISGIPLTYLALYRLIFNKGISKISSALLISMAMIAAIFIGNIFAAGEVAFIMAIGAILEERTVEKAKQGLKNLLDLKPLEGRLIVNNIEKMIPYEQIQIANILRVLPGEVIPADGKIISGVTSIDQSIMTGESIPVDKEIGDSVFCGTINRFGVIDVQATKLGNNNSLQKLISLVQNAEKKQAPMQSIADKWASWLVPLALIIAIITYLITGKIVRAVTVMIVVCPCALVLATPTAIMAAIGQATKRGVIIKSGKALEKMGKVNTIAFDKTGTLSYGLLEVSDCISFDDNLTSNDLLKLTASAEQKSEHPLGKAIVKKAKVKNINLSECNDFQMFPGKGIYAKIEEKKLYCGNEKFLQDKNIDLTHIVKTTEKFCNEGKALILIADEKKCIGVIALSDVIRETAKHMVNKLKSMNTDCILLTGDNEKTARYFAEKSGITNIHSNLLPKEKVAKLEKIKSTGKVVCMIGDGVNDAPSLKMADVGVAMGQIGSDIAIESADVVLMNDKIENIPYLKRLSTATLKSIKFGITLSMGINLIAVILSIMGVLSPITAAIVHNTGSCFVVLIAASLYDRKFD